MISIVLRKFWIALTDLLPIIFVVAFFQGIVIGQPLPEVFEVIFGSLHGHRTV